MRPSLLFLLLLPLLACGGDPSSPAHGGPCPDQKHADLNGLAGRLADRLYELDVSQVLLMKGATERFLYTVSEHDSTYSRQEVYDLMVSSMRIDAEADSIRSLIEAIAAKADSLSDDPEWRDAFDRWKGSIEEAVDRGRGRFDGLTERAATVSLDLLAEPDSPGALALECRAGEVAPRFESLVAFLGGAERAEWRAYLPVLVACVLDRWREEWLPFVRAQIDTMAAVEEPFLGPIGLFHLENVIGAEPGWEEVARWSGETGALRISWSDSTATGDGLAVILPAGGELRGSLYYPFLMRSPPTIEPIPAGPYRVLLFLSGRRVLLSEAIDVAVGETAHFRANPVPLSGEGCDLAGGGVDLWAVDPSSEEHINNDFDMPCETEVWEGNALYQIRYDLDSLGHTCIVRSTVPFRFEVDCGDRTIRGGGTGPIALLPDSTGGFTLLGVSPDSVSMTLAGNRTTTSLSFAFTREGDSYFAAVRPPGGEEESRNVTDRVFPGYGTDLQLGTAQSAEILAPPGADESSPFFIRIRMERIF